MPFSATKGYVVKPAPGVQINPAHPLSKGLVGYWLFNEGAGSRVNDISGCSNHGTLTNIAPNDQDSGWNGNPVGGGVGLDGVNDHVAIPNFPEMDSADSTVCVQLNLRSAIAYKRVVYLKNEIMLVPYGSSTFPYATASIISGGTQYKERGITNTTNLGWCHMAYTYSDSDHAIQIYIDGRPETMAATGTWGYTQGIDHELWIGGRSDAAAYIAADINFVSIYDRVLPDKEIKQVYHDPSCNLLRAPIRYVPAAAGGLSIPVAMHHYRQQRIS